VARLLIVHHTPSPAVRQLLEAVLEGAHLPELADAQVQIEPALSATAADLLAADAVLLITPANIGYMSGALKHFFDTIYYPCLDATRGLPWGLLVHGNDDTAGAVASVTKVSGALQWKQVAQVLSVVGAPDAVALEEARDLAATVCAAALREA
jgi:NAD(P)H-dependent FMN reductase